MANIKPENNASFRPDINGARAIAVIIVVLFHFGLPGFSGGFIGVDVFFVISGFLMTKIIVSRLEQNRFSLGDFLAARVRRIFPALAVLCMTLLAAGWLALDPIDYQTLAVHAASALTFVSNFVFWKQVNYFDAAAHEKWLLHTWSLSAEWQFYLVLPVVLMAIWKLFRSSRALAAGIVIAFVLSLAVSIVVTDLRPIAAYYILPTRAWEMMAGGVVLLIQPHIKLARAGSLGFEWIGLALLAYGTVFLDASDPWPGYLALIPVVGTALIILARNTTSPFTCNAVSSFIGETSYSIYLWHWPVVVWIGFRGLAGSPAAIVAGIAASILLGYLSFRYVEAKTRHAWAAGTKREMSTYLSAAAVLVAIAMVVDYSRGFPHRLAPDEAKYQNVAAAIGDWSHPGANCQVQAYATRCLDQGAADNLVMFIGDSLAEQWYPRYGESAAHDGRTTMFITKGACLPIRGVDSISTGGNCKEFADEAWNEVFTRKPRKLIVASIWVTYFHYETGASRRGICIAGDATCMPVVEDRQIQDVFARLATDIRKAVAQGTEVYVLGPPPMNSADYPKMRLADIASQRLLLPVAARHDAAALRPEFRIDDKSYARGLISDLLQQMADAAGATMIHLDEHMCPGGACSLVDAAGSPINKDTGHLRRTYVRSPSVSWLDTAIGLR